MGGHYKCNFNYLIKKYQFIGSTFVSIFEMVVCHSEMVVCHSDVLFVIPRWLFVIPTKEESEAKNRASYV